MDKVDGKEYIIEQHPGDEFRTPADGFSPELMDASFTIGLGDDKEQGIEKKSKEAAAILFGFADSLEEDGSD